MGGHSPLSWHSGPLSQAPLWVSCRLPKSCICTFAGPPGLVFRPPSTPEITSAPSHAQHRVQRCPMDSLPWASTSLGSSAACFTSPCSTFSRCKLPRIQCGEEAVASLCKMLQNPGQEQPDFCRCRGPGTQVCNVHSPLFSRSFVSHLNYTYEVPCSQQWEPGTFLSSTSQALGVDVFRRLLLMGLDWVLRL